MSYRLKRKLQRQRASRNKGNKGNANDEVEEALQKGTKEKRGRGKRQRLDDDDDATTEQEATPPAPVSPQVERQRQRALTALQDATDLPSSYAALKLVKELVPIDSMDPKSLAVLQQACLAVPYLMFKLAVEHFTRPRSFGGLAFSVAKAKQCAETLFQHAGPACCSATVTEKDLQKAKLLPADARKVLPHLKDVGVEARAQVEAVRTRVMKDEE